MEQKPCALFTPSSLRVDYIDVRSRRAELNKKPQHKQQQQRRRDAEIGKHGFMCACVWRVSHSPTHFFSFVSVACCHTTLFFLVAISQPFRVSYFISVSASLSLSRPFSYVVCYLPEIAMKIPKLISNVTTFIFFFCDSRAFHMTVLITSWRRWLDSVRFNLFSALLISSFSFSFFFLFSTHFISFHFEMFVLILISSEWVWEKYISILVAVIAQQQHQPLASQPSIHPSSTN